MRPRSIPLRTAPIRTTPEQTAPIGTTPERIAPIRTTPERTAPIRTTPVRIAPGALLVAWLCLPFLLSCFSERGSPTETALPAECPDPPPDAAVVVAVRDFEFIPRDVRISAGTEVVWLNCEPEGREAHTTTSDQGVWDSGLLERGDTFRRTFDGAGTFPYHCEPHPFMQGGVTVEG